MGEVFATMAKEIKCVNGLGETWVKMLCSSIDIFYPELELLKAQCSVGVGALKGIQLLLGRTDVSDHQEALQEAKEMVNSSTDVVANHFWAYLAKVEAKAK